MRFIIAMAMALGFCLGARAAEERIQIVVAAQSTGADGSGALFSGSLQRAINDTGRFATVSEKDGAAFVLSINTLGMDDLNNKVLGGAMLSLYQVVLLLRLDNGLSYYLNSWVGFCGQDRATEMAMNISKSVASDVDGVVKLLNSAEQPADEKKPAR